MPDGRHVIDGFQGSDRLLCFAFDVEERCVRYLGFLFIAFHRRNLKKERQYEKVHTELTDYVNGGGIKLQNSVKQCVKTVSK